MFAIGKGAGKRSINANHAQILNQVQDYGPILFGLLLGYKRI
jgi:hypothetical protein